MWRLCGFWLVVLAWWLMSGGLAPGQATTWSHALRFQHFAQNPSLSNLAIRTLAQDRFGLLWVGTDDGLNRYDGRQVKVYRHDPADPNSLPSNSVRRLLAASGGDLWILLTDGHLCRYDHATDCFTPEPIILSGQPAWRPETLEEDRQGRLWLGGWTTLVRYDPRTKTAQSFNLPQNLTQFTENNPFINDLTVDPRGRVWLSAGRRLLLFDLATEVFGVVPDAPSPIDLPVMAHPSGYVYAAAPLEGKPHLLEFDAQSGRLVGQYRVEGSANDAIRSALVHFASDGDFLWMSLAGLGIGRFHVKSKSIDYARYNRANPRSLVGDDPQVALRDRSGVLWVGDNRRGLSKLTPYAGYFKTYRSDPNRQEALSLSDDYIRGMCEDRAGNVWVCTQYGGLNVLDRQSRTIRHVRHRPGDPTALASDNTRAVLEDWRGQLWVGSQGGLQSLDRNSGRFTSFPLPPGGDGKPAMVSVLFEDTDHTLWVGSGGHLLAISPDRRAVSEPLAGRDLPEPLRTGLGEIQAIHRDAHGAMWIGLTKGGLRLGPDGQLRYWKDELGKPLSGVPTVCAFLTDHAGQLWLATKGMGLLRYDAAQDRFHALTERQGLPHHNVYAVLEDRRGRLWMSTDNGLARYDPATGNIRHYRTEEGLQGQEFNRYAYLKTRDGIIFFGGTQGVTAFPPDELEDNPYPPPVVTFVQTARGTRFVLPDGPPLQLAPDERTVTLRFAALDFNAPEANQYAYRIGVRDGEWRLLGGQPELTLADLASGNWVIHVKASNNDGVWNEAGLRVNLYIQPPWWRTTWAYTGYALSVTLLLWGGYRAWTYRARLMMRARIAQARLAAETRTSRQRAKVSRLLAHKNRELAGANDRLRQLDEIKQRFTAMLVHDLKAPLASISMLLELLKTLLEDKIDQEVRGIMDNTSLSAERTLHMINEMLEVMRAESNELKLQLAEMSLHTLLETALQTARPLALAKHQTLTSELPPDLPIVRVDGQKLERAVTNLLSNAVKYTPEGGSIVLAAKVIHGSGVEQGRKFALIQVSDTGVGIPETELPYIFDPYRQALQHRSAGVGLGLSIVRSIIAAHGGNVTVRSQVGVGTTFTILLPLPQPATPNAADDRSDEPANITS
ncbi:MAG: two-component regulator propeller domain-containing protein [Chloracidobacterium sp.]